MNAHRRAKGRSKLTSSPDVRTMMIGANKDGWWTGDDFSE